MKQQKITINVYESDRDWFETLKRKKKKKSMAHLFKSIRRLITKFKLSGELE